MFYGHTKKKCVILSHLCVFMCDNVNHSWKCMKTLFGTYVNLQIERNSITTILQKVFHTHKLFFCEHTSPSYPSLSMKLWINTENPYRNPLKKISHKYLNIGPCKRTPFPHQEDPVLPRTLYWPSSPYQNFLIHI